MNPFEENDSVRNGLVNMQTTFTESSVHNGTSSDVDNPSTSFIRATRNGHVGMDATENALSMSPNEDITSLEKSALVEELVQTLRETYERMPAHLLQYELVKAKAMSVVKFT